MILTADNFPVLCRSLSRKENVFKLILEEYGVPPLWSRPPGFGTIVHIILEQQVSLASALAAWKMLQVRLSEVTPESVLSLDEAAAKGCYVSRQKFRYITELATALIQGKFRFEDLESMKDDAARAALIRHKGIGQWTADIYLMMVLHRADCFPIGDVALVQAMRHLFGAADETREELLMMAEAWRPHRTVATFMLWHYYLSARGRSYPLPAG